jgi:hypothetical protein
MNGLPSDLLGPSRAVHAFRASTAAHTVPLRLAYILAASHSGTTLLAMLLGAHPEIATVGELKLTALGDPTRYRCSCRRLIRDCPFWRGVGEDFAREGLEFDLARAGTDWASTAPSLARRWLAPLHRGPLAEALRDGLLALTPGWRSHAAMVAVRNRVLARSVLARLGKHVLVDSSKIGLRLKFLLRDPSYDIRVIRLVRDGRAVAASYVYPAELADARAPEWRGGGSGGSREAERLSMRAAAREWRRSQEEAQAIIARLPEGRVLELRYEALCLDPAATLERVHRFLGVAPRREVPAFRAVEHHVVGNGMRLDDIGEIRLDERWREYLTAADLAIFEKEAGGLNRRLGYT